MGKQPHHCKALRIPKVHLCRYGRDRGKEDALTWGGLQYHVLVQEKSAEVMVSKGNELQRNCIGLTIREGPNVILFKIRIGRQLV
ncbi:MAG: hypothetical protein COA80_20235 [Leeuwenhoekiella sp.]|nr:MAG: hypothetical protein COA80_20235 [Leeuwenhoekiella sp.]